MGLPWVRLDTQFATNPKLLELVSEAKWRAAFVYVAGLGYAGCHGTDGYIPDSALPFIHATKRQAIDLLKAGLWDEDIGGWRVHDWQEFQVTDEAAVARSERARKAAFKRWHGLKGTD